MRSPTHLPSYAGTDDLVLAWSSNVPADWKVRRLRTVADVRMSTVDKHTRSDEQPVRLCNYMDVYGNDRIHPGIAFMPATATAAEIDRFRLNPEDVLITKDSETWMDIGIPALVETAVTEMEILCGYHCALLRPHRSLRGSYLFWFLRSSPGERQFRGQANGVTRYGLTQATIKSVQVPVPPLREQTAIVQLLDYVDRRIEQYTEAKEKLIALLEEQKRALIHQAVTGQVDVRTGETHTTYQDSDLEWLTETPAHWSELTVGTASNSIQTGPFGSQLHANEYVVDGVPVINPSHLSEGRIAPDHSVAVTEQKATELSRHRLAPGDVVMARRGEVGRSALVRSPEAGWLCGTGSLRIRTRATVCSPEYLLLVLNSSGSRDALELASVGSTMPNLNAKIVSRLRICLPPLPEQTAITKFCRKVTDRHTAATDHTRRQIVLLREFRTRLIADVVTGKLDVRYAAASLPEVDPLGDDPA